MIRRRTIPESITVAVFSQDEKRTRRRQQMAVTYSADFDLLAEIHDSLNPAARRIAREPLPLGYRPVVDEVVDAVHTLVTVVARLVVTADAQRAAAHITDVVDRRRAVKLLVERAQRPARPGIADELITAGGWVVVLTDFAGPWAGKLADLLGRAAAPGTRHGAPSVSETLTDALRELDRAALSLSRRLGTANYYRSQQSTGAVATALPSSDPVADELAALGVQVIPG